MDTESAGGGSGGGVREELDRDIGLIGAIALGVGTMIAAGIFVLSGLAVSNVGAMAIVAFLIAAVVASFTALTYGEFSAIYPESGGGYAYVANTFDRDWTYIVGWSMILGYPASAAFYLASFSNWFYRFMYPVLNIPEAIPYWIPGLVILGLLLGLNLKGTEETGTFQIVVTALKVALIILFLYGGLQAFQTDVIAQSVAQNTQSLTDFRNIGVTSALVFITFFGFEAIATNAEEIEKPGTNIPRAIFISMGFVTFVYALVVLVIVFAVNNPDFLGFLAQQAGLAGPSAAQTFIANSGEVSMAYAAQYYLGPVGFYVIIVGALFSMLSAANATVLAGSRVKLAMSRRGHLPSQFEDLHPTYNTPHKAVLLTGGLIALYILLFTVAFGNAPGTEGSHGGGFHLGIDAVTHYADFLLLTGLIAVNVAVVRSRRKYPDLDRPFTVPAVPYLPALAVVANLVLLVNVEPKALAIGLLAEVIGVGLWFAVVSGVSTEQIEKETPTVLGEEHPHEHDYQLLVPIANRDSVEQLMRTAVDIVNDRDGEILVLNVLTTPEQTPFAERQDETPQRRELVREAMSIAEEAGVPVGGTVRFAHDPEHAILNTAEQYGSEGILMGWGGHRSHRRNIIVGSTVDEVVTEADADVYVEKIGAESGTIESILLPTAGGPHAELAAEIARTIARTTGAVVHAVRVVDPNEGSVKDARAQLEEVAAAFDGSGVEVETRVIEHDDVVEALVEEADEHDLTIIGSTREGLLQQLVFGAIPEAVGDRARNTAIMVQRNVGAGSRIRRWIGGD